jgi:hypothetical protein
MFASYRNSPTLDIYFREPLKDLIASRAFVHAKRPIRRIGPNAFVCNGRAVIIRYATRGELSQIRKSGISEVFYVVDDDFFQLAEETSLPDDYRGRLQRFADTILPDILEISDTIVSPSRVILDRFEGRNCEELAPAYLFLCHDFSHFDGEGAIAAVFPGTRSHINDLAAIAPAIEQALAAHEQLTLTTFLGGYGDALLGRHPRVRNLKPQSWGQYRRTMATGRFHLALVPYAESAFNRARSINKMHDVAAFGAAGLFSDRRPSSEVINHNENGLLLSDDAQDWTNAIGHLIVERGDARRLAVANVDESRRLGDPARVRDFWLSHLFPDGLPESVAQD